MKVSDILEDSNKTRFSLEIYPPKIVAEDKTRIQFQLSKIFETVERLLKYNPAFVSVTYNPEGKTKLTSIPLAAIIKQRFNVETVAHLTCIATPREDLSKTLDVIDYFGIKNILALRGDVPPCFTPKNNEMKFASDLVEELIKRRIGKCIGAACYPEGHVECLNRYGKRDKDRDLVNFKQKVEKGVEFAITQLFFENRIYFDFVKKARKIGIEIPIIPGIFPIFNYRNIQAIAQLSGTNIPESLKIKIEKNREYPLEIKSIGIDYAVKQCKRLIDKVPCIHFYTMDKWESVESIIKALG